MKNINHQRGVPGILTQAICLLAGLLFSLSANADLYAVDIDTNQFFRIEVPSADEALIGDTGANVSFSGLALDSTTGTLFASDIQNPDDDDFYGLATVNPNTGAVSYIGDHVNSINIWALAYLPGADRLVGSDGDNNGLAEIDRTTGESTLIGSFGQSEPQICGIAFDSVSNTLYGVDASAPESRLYVIDPDTGSASVVGELGVALDTDNVRCGLTVAPDGGDLIAGAYSGALYQVDTITGVATPFGTTSISIDALAGVPFAAEARPVAIPALGYPALLALSGMLLLLGHLPLRRRP